MHRRQLLALMSATLCSAWALPASAQAFPNKPIKLVIAFPAGGPTDVLARDLALAGRAPLLLLDARLALVVELIERDRGRRLGRGIHPHRDGDQTDLEETFPGGTRSHENRPCYRAHAGRH